MALLQGFPASNTLSPTVRIAEVDLSFVPPNPTFHSVGLVGFASKGPINLPTIITSTQQLTKFFGNPHPATGDPYLIYAAQQYLLTGSQLIVVRVANEDPVSDEQCTTASVELPAAGSLISITSATTGPYVFGVDSFFRWSLNGVLAPKTLVVLAGSYTVTELMAALNDQLSPIIDGIEFFVSTSNTIGVQTTFAYGPASTLEMVSVQDSIYGGTLIGTPPNVTGLGTGMTQASTTGSAAKYPNTVYQTNGNYDFTGLTGLNLQIVIDGTDNVLIDQVVQVIDLSDLEGRVNIIADIVTEINNQTVANGGTLPGGWLCSATSNNLTFNTLTFGEDARLLIKSDSTADQIFGFDNLTKVGLSPQGATNDLAVSTFGIVSGVTAAGNTCLLTADSPGIDGNSTQVVVTNDTRSGVFSFDVYNNGSQVEVFGNLTKDPSSTLYYETYLALVSDYVRVVDDTTTGAPPLNGTYSLSGGSDGIPADPDDQDSLLVGSPAAFTGIYILSEPEQIDIDMIAVPGHPSTSVVTALLDMCQSMRGDCLAIIDPPFGLTVEEIVAWQNGTHPLNASRFDTDFGALYWPWVKYRDTFNQVDVWIPPSGAVLATITRSDNIGAPWLAPAGLTRGNVPGIEDVFSRPTQTERDLMYGNNNAINPIIQFANSSSFVIWGQKTLQREGTALNRINVRRMMFVIEKQIRTMCRSLLFDPNDAIFQSKFVTQATAILNAVQIGEGLHAFIILADSTINTPDVIDRNEFRAQIGIQPTRAVEFMFIEFTINRTGSFTENA